MVTETRPKSVTAEELLQLSKEDFYGELIQGVLVEEMPPGVRHALIVAKLIALLLSYVEEKELGSVLADAGILTERNPDTVCAPDVQFFDHHRLPLDAEIPAYAEVAPNLAVEVRLPNDSRRALHEQANKWLNDGVQVVWIVQPDSHSVDVYRSGQDTIRLSGTNSLEGLDVLPGFRCELEDVFGPARADATRSWGLIHCRSLKTVLEDPGDAPTGR